MEVQRIQHRPRHLRYALARRLEIEESISHCPQNQPHICATCPDCDCTMAYRGIARLRSGTKVHYFECVHSYREVHTLSIVISESD